MGGSSSRVCVAIDDPTLRRRVRRSLIGVASETIDIYSVAEQDALRRRGDEALLIVLGPCVGGVDLTPAAVHRVRTADPLVPIIVCLPPRHSLQRRLSELALAGADRVLTLDAPDQDADLRHDASEALRHVLPSAVELGVDTSIRTRAVALELFCARNAYLHLTVQLLAHRFDVGPAAILKSAKSEGWRDAASLIGASRALHVAFEMERSSGGAGVIAESLHFGTPSAVQHHMKRKFHRTMKELKFEGALNIAAEVWRRRGYE
jgi:hypothetical protein